MSECSMNFKGILETSKTLLVLNFEKFSLLDVSRILSLYSVLTISSCIIFCYTRSSTIWLAERFKEKGRDVALLHGELSVDERAKVVEKFKRGDQKILITTNVAARGLDIPQVSLVINYDPPVTYEEMPQPDFDTYLHRMGRTGRFGKPGIVINLADSDIAMNYVYQFQAHFGRVIQPLDANDYDQMERIEESTRQM
uniref:Helicase C-terminal domain-containing protein n=1 Tax=Meloidogyne incognita TaxID=6306 RepID=A0A914KS12_MELIC